MQTEAKSSASSKIKAFLATPSAKRWGLYLLKAIVLLAALLLLGHFAPSMPPFAVALFWAALSALSALYFAYYVVIKKTLDRTKYREGGLLQRINEGRIARIILGFIVSASCMAGLIMELPKWGVGEWAIAVAGIPIYLVIFLLMRKRLDKEYEEAFRAGSVVKWAGIISCALLCLAFGVFCALQPAVTYGSAAEAFQAAQHPFENSPSALMTEAGLFSSLIDGFTAFGASEIAGAFLPAYIVWRIVLVATSFLGITNLLGVCALEPSEIKRIFTPLESALQPAEHNGILKRYAIAMAILPLCLIATFLTVDFKATEARQTDGYTAAENFVRSQVNLAVYAFDGKYYDRQSVDDLLEQTRNQSNALIADAKEKLTPLINASYDARVANVDKYLDWYYSLPADYERLASMITGTVEDYVADQFSAKIEEGIDDTQLEAELESFLKQAEQIETDAKQKMEEVELPDVPEWLITTKDILDSDFLSKPMEPTQKLMDAGTRLAISGAVGTGAGALTKALVSKAIKKEFCTKAISKIGSALASRGIGAAAGATVGTVAGPLGTIAGLGVGTAVGVGIDYVLLNIDEMQNRKTYKQEIIDTIEEERAEKLALVA